MISALKYTSDISINQSIYLFPLILYTRYGKHHVHKTKQYKAYIYRKKAIKTTILPLLRSIAADIHRYVLLIVIKDRSLGYWSYKPYTPLMINKFCWFSIPKIGKVVTIIAFA